MATTSSLIILNKAEAGAELEAVNIGLGILAIFLSLALNGIVLVVLRHLQELQEYMRVLYQVLAVSNIAFGVILNLWGILWLSVASTKSCGIMSMVFPLGYQVSFLSIMACLSGISFHLYLLVTRPLRYYTIMTRTRFYFSLAATFLVIMLVCLIYLPIPESPFIKLLITHCLDRDTSTQAQWTSLFHTIVQVCPVFATMAFTTIIYIRLLFILRNIRNIAPDPARDANMNLGRPTRRNFKGFFTILLLSGSFYIVWTPYVISFVTPLHPSFQRILYHLHLCITSVQPLVYLVTNSEARKLCLTSLCQCLNKMTRKNNIRG